MTAMVQAAKLAAVGAVGGAQGGGASPQLAASAATASLHHGGGGSSSSLDRISEISNSGALDCGQCPACRGLVKPCGRCGDCRFVTLNPPHHIYYCCSCM